MYTVALIFNCSISLIMQLAKCKILICLNCSFIKLIKEQRRLLFSLMILYSINADNAALAMHDTH